VPETRVFPIRFSQIVGRFVTACAPRGLVTTSVDARGRISERVARDRRRSETVTTGVDVIARVLEQWRRTDEVEQKRRISFRAHPHESAAEGHIGRHAIRRAPDWSGFAAACRTNVAAVLRSPVVVLRRQRLVSQSTRMIVVDHPVQR
jgi:hypothetical protein